MRRRWFAVVLPITACTNAVSPNFDSLPPIIHECETHTARVCGTWTRSNNSQNYSAVWAQNSTATIRAVRWTDDLVEFERSDTGGPTPNMKARYLAIRNGNAISFGQVRWINDGLTIFGTWDATW